MHAGETTVAGPAIADHEGAGAAAVPRWPYLMLVVGAGALDCAVVGLAYSGQLALPATVALHIAAAALAALPVLLDRSPVTDKTMPMLAAVAITAVGPLGALGAVMTALLAPARPRATPLLEAWYQRIAHSVETDPVSQLSDVVSIGRAVNLTGGPPVSFARVMTHGSLADRQALLGLVARRFDIAYLPALKIALTNPEPVIRVQAAAVATRVRHELSRVIAAWDRRTAEHMGGVEALGAMVELEACLGSGLIEAGDRTCAAAALLRARATATARTKEPRFAHRLLASGADKSQLLAATAYERLLVEERRFRELRNWRRLRPAGLHPVYRLRHRPRRPRARLLAAGGADR